MPYEKALVLFDIDGTILSMDYRQSKNTFIKVFEQVFDISVPEDKLPEFSGNTDLGIVKHIANELDIPFHEILVKKQKFWDLMDEAFLPLYREDNLFLHPYVVEVIQEFDKQDDIELGLLTGNNKIASKRKLDVFGLNEYFIEGAFGCDHFDRNLLPQIAWDRFSFTQPENRFVGNNTIIIGDSPKDILCAQYSGIKSITVSTGSYSKDKLSTYGPDIALDNFQEPEKMIGIIRALIN